MTQGTRGDEIDGYNEYGVPYINRLNVHGTFVECLNGIAERGGSNVIRHAETDAAQMVLLCTDWEGGKAFLVADVRSVNDTMEKAIEVMREHSSDPRASAERIRGLEADGDVEFEQGWLCMRDERHGRTEYIVAEVTAIEQGVPEAAALLTHRITGGTH